eukprot:5961217-Prymnesium_polylepis.1
MPPSTAAARLVACACACCVVVSGGCCIATSVCCAESACQRFAPTCSAIVLPVLGASGCRGGWATAACWI